MAVSSLASAVMVGIDRADASGGSSPHGPLGPTVLAADLERAAASVEGSAREPAERRIRELLLAPHGPRRFHSLPR